MSIEWVSSRRPAQAARDDRHTPWASLARHHARSWFARDAEALQPEIPRLPAASAALLSALGAAPMFQPVRFALAWVDADRHVLHHNAAMHVVLSRHDGLIVEGGVLRANLEREQQALVHAIREVTHGERERSGLIIFARGAGQPPYLARVERHVAGSAGDSLPEPAVRLAIVDPDDSDASAIAEVADHFGLTRSETEIVQAMLLGLDAGECAERLRLAIHTIRWHQKRIFSKIGVTSRPALILLFVRGLQLLGVCAGREPIGASPLPTHQLPINDSRGLHQVEADQAA